MREERLQQGEGLGVCLHIEEKCVHQITVQCLPCLRFAAHLEQSPDDGDSVAKVLEGPGLFVGVVGPLGEVVDDLLSEMVAVLVAQPAEGNGPDDRVQVPAAGLPVVLQQATLLEVAHGRGKRA